MIKMHEKITGKITDNWLKTNNIANLGAAYFSIGDVRKSVRYLEQALELDRENKDRQGEGADIGNLGNAYNSLGDIRKAIEFHEQALLISREIGDKVNEGRWLSNLGGDYSKFGEIHKAIKYFEQALAIAREIDDRRGEGTRLCNLGNCYVKLGDGRKAVEYYEQALVIAREIGDRYVEGASFDNIGLALLTIEGFQNAVEKFQYSIIIAEEISNAVMQNYARCGLAQAYLFQNDLVNARATIEAALQYDVPENNHNASTLRGIIALRQGDEVAARGAFVRAIGQAEEILSKTAEFYDALDAKGLALCGLALVGAGLGRDTNDAEEASRSKRDLQDAFETFRKARRIAPHAGIVKRNLRLFDELAKCDTEGILKEVREAVEGK